MEIPTFLMRPDNTIAAVGFTNWEKRDDGEWMFVESATIAVDEGEIVTQFVFEFPDGCRMVDGDLHHEIVGPNPGLTLGPASSVATHHWGLTDCTIPREVRAEAETAREVAAIIEEDRPLLERLAET